MTLLHHPFLLKVFCLNNMTIHFAFNLFDFLLLNCCFSSVDICFCLVIVVFYLICPTVDRDSWFGSRRQQWSNQFQETTVGFTPA